MNHLAMTKHAERRIRQRGFRDADILLLFEAATQIGPESFMLKRADADREIAKRKREIQQLERLTDSVLIVEGGDVITCYHKTGTAHSRKRKRGQS